MHIGTFHNAMRRTDIKFQFDNDEAGKLKQLETGVNEELDDSGRYLQLARFVGRRKGGQSHAWHEIVLWRELSKHVLFAECPWVCRYYDVDVAVVVDGEDKGAVPDCRQGTGRVFEVDKLMVRDSRGSGSVIV
jgi:hypothetical protein